MPSTEEIKAIFDSFIPAIQVGRVTLENGGGIYQNKENPHIDYDVTSVGYNEFGEPHPQTASRALADRVGSEGSSIQRNKNGPEGMKVTCNLIIKDIVTPGVVGTFFRNRDLTKLLTVRFVYAKTPEAMEEIINNNPTLDNFQVRSDLIKLTDASLESIIPSDIFDPVEPTKEKPVVYNNRSIKVDADGNEIHSFTFDRVIDGLPNNTKFLAVFACCRIDLDRLFADAPGTLEVNPNVYNDIPKNLLASKLSYNVILQGGNIASRMPIFVDEETGELWEGPVHGQNLATSGIQINSSTRWKTGETETPDSKFLIRKTAPNSRVQDFRISSMLDDRTFEIHNTDKEIMDSFMKEARNESLNINYPKTYFSGIRFARDESGDSRFFFSMDYNRILQENTAFGALLMKKNLLSSGEVAAKCKITSFKVFRTRLVGSPEAGSKPFEVISHTNMSTNVPFNPILSQDMRRFSDNEVDKLIVSAREVAGSIPPTNHTKIVHSSPNMRITGIDQSTPAPVTESIIGTIEEITNLNLSNAIGIRHFSGIDKTMGGITDGYYQYRIEIEIYDGTDEFLREALGELLVAQRTLRQHLYLITRPGAPVVLTDQYGSAIGHAVNTYLRHLFIFTKPKKTKRFFKLDSSDFGDKEYDPIVLQQQLIGWCGREIPHGTSKIITLMDLLIRKLADVGNLVPFLEFEASKYPAVPITTCTGDSSPFQQPRALMNSSTQKTTFQIKNNFNTYFNSNIDISTSYDFMNLPVDADGHGFKKSDGSFFLRRVKAETNRLFAQRADNIEWEINGEPGNPGDSTHFTAFSYFAPYTVIQPVGIDNIQLAGSSPSPPISNESLLIFNFSQQGATPNSLLANSSLQRPSNQAYQFLVDNVSVADSPVLCAAIESLTFKMAEMGVVAPVMGVGVSLAEYFGIEDPVEKDNTTCYPSVDSNLSMNPAPLFNRLMEQLNPGSYAKGSKFASTGGIQEKEIGARRQAEAARRAMETARNIPTLFNPDAKGGPVSQFMMSPSNQQTIRTSPQAPQPRNTTWSQRWVATMPNHIKALVKQNSATSDVLPVNDIQLIQQAFGGSIAAATEVSLKFTKINVVEVLIGYDDDPASDWVSLKNPIWKILDAELYNKNNGTPILCRLKPYHNPMFGIVWDEKIEPPTIDEYFFLTPSGGAVLPNPAVLPEAAATISAPFPQNRQRDVSDITAASFGEVPANIESLLSLSNTPANSGGS